MIEHNPDPIASPDHRRRIPRLLAGIGIYGTATFLCDVATRAWPGAAPLLFTGLLLFGMVWLSILVLRTCEYASVASAAGLDRLMIRFAGPLSVIILVLAGALAFLTIEQVKGVNHFSSRLSEEVFQLLMTTGFVLALCSIVSRRGMHVPPHLCWRLIAIPLIVIFGMYVLFTPIGCYASRYGIR